jgi:hypothetical protein
MREIDGGGGKNDSAKAVALEVLSSAECGNPLTEVRRVGMRAFE